MTALSALLVNANQWYDVGPSPDSVKFTGFSGGFGNTTNMRWFCESGGAYDSSRNRMYVWGGGHADYAGNEIYAFSISALTWSRINTPSLFYDSFIPATEDTGYYPTSASNSAPDLQQPRSVHSYWYTVYCANIDRFCHIGGTFNYPNASSSDTIDCFNFTTGLWEQKSAARIFSGLATATYDPATGLVWVFGYNPANGSPGEFGSWNPNSDVWDVRTVTNSGLGNRVGPCLDTSRHRLMFMGSGKLQYMNLSGVGTLTPTTVTGSCTGATEILAEERGGFAYDPDNDEYVAWAADQVLGLANTDIYTINPTTWVITKTTLAGTPPRYPTPFGGGGGLSNGVYGRFQYIPAEQAFVLINNQIDDHVFAFRRTAAPASNGRIVMVTR